MASEKQVGILGEREPELCAVSGRSLLGKHAVTHYKGDNVHYVRVLNQFDHLWSEAAEQYGFPVPQTEEEVVDDDVFVVEALKDSVVDTGSNLRIDRFDLQPNHSSLNVSPVTSSISRSTRTPKPPTSAPAQTAPADSISKGDD
jgi:hypothetical protein